MATLIIVSGPSASGKSTLSRKLAKDLTLPMISRDLIKEAMFDTLGYSDRKRSIEFGIAAALILLREVEEFLNSGVSCIIESNFRPKYSEAEFVKLLKDTGADVVQIQCICDGPALFERFKDRSLKDERHPGHGDSGNWEEFKDELLAGRYPNLELGSEVLEYDTSKQDEERYRALRETVKSKLAPSKKS